MSSTAQRLTPSSSNTLLSLKRPAQDDNELQEQRQAKRHHTMTTDDEVDMNQGDPQAVQEPITDNDARMAIKYLESMEDELRCGCCTELLYRPVEILPCAHYFCGSCTVLFVQNGGTSCPACRQPSTSVAPSRLLQGFIDALLKIYPEKQRTQSERDQADEIYQSTSTISIPPPKPPTREDALLPRLQSHNPPPDNLARPCPHCLPNNEFQWTCPHPLADPETDPQHAWNLNNGIPPHHAWCGYCDELHALGAPTTTRCSICRTSFCGLSVPHLCIAASMHSANLPVSISGLSGLIQTGDIYDAFNDNATEVDILFDWLREDGRGPRGMLFEILEFIQSNPAVGFRQLIDQGVFPAALEHEREENTPAPPALDPVPVPVPEPTAEPVPAEPRAQSPPIDSSTVNPTEPVVAETLPRDEPLPTDNTSQPLEPTPAQSEPPAEPPLQAQENPPAITPVVPADVQPPVQTFTRICRDCSHKVFFWGIYDWWSRERAAIIDRMKVAKEAAAAAAANPPPVTADIPVVPEVPISDSATEAAEHSDDDGSDSDDGGHTGDNDVVRSIVLPDWVISDSRNDCVDGRHCMRQSDMAHAKEFNHVIAPPVVRPSLLSAESTTNPVDSNAAIDSATTSAAVQSTDTGISDGDIPMSDAIPAPVSLPANGSTVSMGVEDGDTSSTSTIEARRVEQTLPQDHQPSGPTTVESSGNTTREELDQDEDDDVDVEMAMEGPRDADFDMVDAEPSTSRLSATTTEEVVTARAAGEPTKSILISADDNVEADVRMEETDSMDRAVVGIHIIV